MPRCFVKQPNGLIAIWSSIVDDFISVDNTADEAIHSEVTDRRYSSYPGDLYHDLAKELCNIATEGRAWKWAPNWQEAIETIRELHGDDKANERLAMIDNPSAIVAQRDALLEAAKAAQSHFAYLRALWGDEGVTRRVCDALDTAIALCESKAGSSDEGK